MKFSVLMSVYKNDNPEHLRRAIQSVTTEQTLKPAQLVLVKDGPLPEETDAVICDMQSVLQSADIEFTVIPKEVNAGLAAALNTGLDYCRYEYVARMDSDDVSLPNRFKLQLPYISQNSDISVLGGGITEFEDDENTPIQARIVPQMHNDILDMLKTRNAMNHVTVVFKKSDILCLGGYSESFGKHEDYKLWVDAVCAGLKLQNISDICVNVRVGAGFIERRSNKREIQDWDMLQKYLMDAHLIGGGKAFMNKLYIRAFIYMPAWMKKIAYKTVLRKKN